MIAPPPSRNDPCPCGSGLRYKHCHGRAGDVAPSGSPAGAADSADRTARGPAEASPIASARRAPAAGRRAEAIAEGERLVATDAADVGAWRLLGEACAAADPVRAEDCWQRVLALVPGDPEALFQLGNIALARGDTDAAIARLEASLRGAPGHAGVLNNLGLALERAGRIEAAEPLFRQVADATPNAFEPLANLAQNLYQQKRFAEALGFFDALIARFPVDQPAIWANRSICLSQLGKLEEAEPGLRKALALAPATATLYRDSAINCIRMKRYEDAVEALGRCVALDPDDLLARSMLLCAELNTARWDRFADTSAAIVDAVATLADHTAQSVSAFDFTVLCDDPALQRNAARRWIRGQAAFSQPLKGRARGTHDRLRLGFVSTDLYNHPVGRLIVSLIERLDRSRFTVAAYAVEATRNDEISRRIEAAADAHRKTPGLDPDGTAAIIRGDEIDVLFDLNGLTGTQMIPIFALRPAPIQVNFLGYTGTLGAACYDWIITDQYCIPATARIHYDERPVYVDPCYLPSDTLRVTDGAAVRRTDYGLPADAIVFCAPSAIYKVLPAMFAQWTALLARHPGSVLWLRAATAPIAARLRQAAQARGIDGERLVFAPPEPLPRYLARFRLADLFLDTYPYGAHTSVNDALFMGLPGVTIAGRSFAARASASQLIAAGLADLVAHDFDEYLEIADGLAASPARLAVITDALRKSGASCPLFDMDRYARAFETAISTAWHEAASG